MIVVFYTTLLSFRDWEALLALWVTFISLNGMSITHCELIP